MTEEQIFLAALDLPNQDHRSAYLDSVCGSDSELRRQVEELLVAHFKSGEFLDEPVGQQLGTTPILQVEETLIVAHQPVEDAVANRPRSPEDSTDEPNDLSFLEPSARSDSLGRIGHYETLQVLGKGGFGIVFRAFDDVLQRVVALKVLAPAIAATSPARKRFLREAQASARVRHENVVQVHAVEELPTPYLVMEFIAGETLQQRLDRKGPLEAPEIVRLARQVAEGLAAAHETGLIHRDIKPGNVLIEGGANERVKITDFGLARAADDASMTQSGTVAGTPMFMAPEQAQGDILDQRADLFSLGSVMYAMASGRPPFRAATTFAVLKRVVEETPRSIKDIIPETPHWLCDIISKLHEKKPDDRFQTAREVADVLADCEEQLKAHERVQDLSRIPARSALRETTNAPTTYGRLRTAGIAVAVIIILAGLTWLGPSLGLLLGGNARVKCLTRDGDTHVEFVAGGRVVGEQVGYGELVLPKGNYELRVTKPDPALRIYNAVVMRRNWLGMYEQVTLSSPPKNLQLKAGDRVDFMVAYVRRDASSAPTLVSDSDGWVQLFNGMDLTGWKKHPNAPAPWGVVNGILEGSSSKGFLFSERGDYQNFRLRVEVKINAGGDSEIDFRAPFDAGKVGRNLEFYAGSGGYITYIHKCVRMRNRPTPSIARSGPFASSPAALFTVQDDTLIRPDEWFTLELIADGNLFITKINGKEAANCTDPLNAYDKGHIALGLFSDQTVVQYRKIEIKELPPSAQESLPPTFKNTLGMEFVRVPKGTSWLGGGKDKPGDKEVEIPADFYLGKFEVTQEEWEKVMGENPSKFSRTGEGMDAVKDINDADLKRFPVENVSWDQCQDFVAKLNKQEKETGWVYRLPTEAEWEYACRGGPMADKADSAFDFYFTKPTNTLLPEQANIYGKGLKRTCKVGSYEANVLGLYDVYGNVREWCADTHQAPDASHRVNRGGGWDFGSVDCRTADRRSDPPSWVAANLGLRLARVPTGAPSPEAKTPVAFKSLFNGKDLSGWKTHPDRPDGWKVEDGILVGRANELSHLFSDRGDFENFHLRAEVKVNGPLNGSLQFRSEYGFGFDLKRVDPSSIRTLPVGYELVFPSAKDGAPEFLFARLTPEGIQESRNHLKIDGPKSGDWVTLEVIARGAQITIVVNGKVMHDFHESNPFRRRGHIVLQAWHGTVASVRKIEIQELPAIAMPDLPPPFTDADVKRIAALPAKEQVEEVKVELMRRNPAFDGKLETKIEGDMVTEFKIVTDKVTDISPIRVFSALRALNLSGSYSDKPNGQLADLTALQGMNLAGLTHLDLRDTQVTDESMVVFHDCQELSILFLTRTKLTDRGLAHLADCKNLAFLSLGATEVSDAGLTHFQNCKGLTYLNLGWTKVTDAGLAHFQDCKELTVLELAGTKVSDNGLAKLKGLPLKSLWIYKTAITDLSPVQGMPLEEIRLTPKNITRGLDLLREMQNLKTIGIESHQSWPAKEFWERHDKGEFRQ